LFIEVSFFEVLSLGATPNLTMELFYGFKAIAD